MNTNLSPVLEILYEVETARKEGCRRVCELLSLNPTSTIAGILAEKEQRLGAFDTNLLDKVAKTVEDHNIKRNITDWPFEHFWGNPYEPRHSKLLGYFIDPNAAHGCGSLLLGKLFEVLKDSFPPDHHFRVEHCRVSQPEYIDLLIEMDCKDEKYAIIIENKINWAKDQLKQLQRYVESVIQRGFDVKQIYVFYLPLTLGKNPNPDDVDTIRRKLGVNYKKITFETHIQNWLESVLTKDPDPEWPSAMQGGMCENLSHYRNLIRYLVNKQKELKMNHEILKQLEQAEKKNLLPTWSQVESLQKSAIELKQCLESVVRGKMLLEIQKILLQRQVKDVWLCLETEPTEEIKDASPYDERFGANVDLCVFADDTVSVCFGGGPEGFWLGYMRSDSPDKQKKMEQSILSEAQERIKSIEGNDKTWYAWVWRREVTYDNCEVNSSPIAEKLVDMRNSLVDRLKVKGVRS